MRLAQYFATQNWINAETNNIFSEIWEKISTIISYLNILHYLKKMW